MMRRFGSSAVACVLLGADTCPMGSYALKFKSAGLTEIQSQKVGDIDVKAQMFLQQQWWPEFVRLQEQEQSGKSSLLNGMKSRLFEGALSGSTDLSTGSMVPLLDYYRQLLIGDGEYFDIRFGWKKQADGTIHERTQRIVSVSAFMKYFGFWYNHNGEKAGGDWSTQTVLRKASRKLLEDQATNPSFLVWEGQQGHGMFTGDYKWENLVDIFGDNSAEVLSFAQPDSTRSSAKLTERDQEEEESAGERDQEEEESAGGEEEESFVRSLVKDRGTSEAGELQKQYDDVVQSVLDSFAGEILPEGIPRKLQLFFNTLISMKEAGLLSADGKTIFDELVSEEHTQKKLGCFLVPMKSSDTADRDDKAHYEIFFRAENQHLRFSTEWGYPALMLDNVPHAATGGVSSTEVFDLERSALGLQESQKLELAGFDIMGQWSLGHYLDRAEDSANSIFCLKTDEHDESQLRRTKNATASSGVRDFALGAQPIVASEQAREQLCALVGQHDLNTHMLNLLQDANERSLRIYGNDVKAA